jgi:uncharacterized protein (TIGR03067 family)
MSISARQKCRGGIREGTRLFSGTTDEAQRGDSDRAGKLAIPGSTSPSPARHLIQVFVGITTYTGRGIMRFLGLLVLAGGLLVGTKSLGDEPQGDKDKIQGTWKVVSFDTTPLEKLPSTKVVITADKFKGLGLVVKYKIDPIQKPKTIDLEGKEGDRDIKQRGIYVLDGDNLKLYWGANRKSPRPTKFPKEPNKDNSTRLLVLKRVKAKE